MIARPTNPTNTTTKETTNMPSKPRTATPTAADYAGVTATDDEVSAALAAISDTGAPRHLASFDQEAWTAAVAVIEQWITPHGSPAIEVRTDQMAADLLRLSPMPRIKANVRVRKMLADMIARSIDNGGERLAQVQIGDEVESSPVLVHALLPEHSRTAAAGFVTAVIVWYPDGGYTFTDPDTAERVTIPSLFKGTPAGFARRFRNIEDGEAEFALLKSAVWTLRKMATPPAAVEDDDEPTARPVQICAI